MGFSDLYKAVQDQADRISTNWLRQKAIEFSEITAVREQWSGLVDPVNLRGFYIEGPMGPPVVVGEGEALIVISREICLGAHGGKHMRRYVLTKELMHVFDTDEEKTDTREKFDRQTQRLKDPTADPSPQYRAEIKAALRALAVLCTQKKRAEYKALLQQDKTSWEVVAASLRIPVAQVRIMMEDTFEEYLRHVMT